MTYEYDRAADEHRYALESRRCRGCRITSSEVRRDQLQHDSTQLLRYSISHTVAYVSNQGAGLQEACCDDDNDDAASSTTTTTCEPREH